MWAADNYPHHLALPWCHLVEGLRPKNEGGAHLDPMPVKHNAKQSFVKFAQSVKAGIGLHHRLTLARHVSDGLSWGEGEKYSFLNSYISSG